MSNSTTIEHSETIQDNEIKNEEIAIKVENLSKIYRLYDTPLDRLKESLHPFKKKYHREFYALRDVNFEVKKGETVGIIGKNGSGKSTLLKIITGVLTPTSGNITVSGKISALLELGTGFNPEFTGIENIYFSGTIMGYTKEEIDKKVDDIVAFADIGEFINQPVKTYSSGMYVRLAFAVATSIDPEILIVDEALSVGDMFFQAKCMTKMKKMIESEQVTLLFVSHSLGAVKSLCRKAILLNNGKMLGYDTSSKIVENYFSIKVESEQKVIVNKNTSSLSIISDKESLDNIFINNQEFQKRASFQRIQNGKAQYVNIQLLDNTEKEIVNIEYEEIIILRMAIEILEDIPILAYGYHIRDANGVDIVYSDSEIEERHLISPKKWEKYIIDWKFKVSLIHGSYNIACVLSIPINLSISQVNFCDFIPLAAQFQMNPRRESMLYGSIHWDNEIKIEQIR